MNDLFISKDFCSCGGGRVGIGVDFGISTDSRGAGLIGRGGRVGFVGGDDIITGGVKMLIPDS